MLAGFLNALQSAHFVNILKRRLRNGAFCGMLGRMNIVIVAEKPSVGRDIARVLGASQRGDGLPHGQGYIVTWALGHLVSLMEPDELDEQHAI